MTSQLNSSRSAARCCLIHGGSFPWIRYRRRRAADGELQAVVLAPAAELRDGGDVRRARVLVADRGGKEFRENVRWPCHPRRR